MKLTRSLFTDDFTVHNFTHASSSNSTSSTQLVQAGREAINQATGPSGWFNANINISIPRCGGNIYRLSTSPPVVNHNGDSSPIELKNWTTRVYSFDEETFSLQELEDFESTNLDHLLRAAASQKTNHEKGTSPPRTGPSINLAAHLPPDLSTKVTKMPQEPSVKRSRLDFSSLHDVIPQPHFYSSPRLSFTTEKPSHTFPRYFKAKPAPIIPFTRQSAGNFLTTLFARSAWIIPIRGILPWDQCTPANVLEANARVMVSDLQDIIWTHASLNAFWEFLQVLRKLGSLGPLSLSFHATSSMPMRSSSDVSGSMSNNAAYQQSGSNTTHSHRYQAGLLSTDHIKIYHNVEHAMFIRNVLDAWKFEDTTGEALNSEALEKRKNRVLLGARLALVDERSKGVLVL